MKKLFLLAIVVLGFTAVSFGQIGQASATLGHVLTVSQTTPLNFGSISLPTDGNPSFINMSNVGAVTAGGGTSIPLVLGGVTPAMGVFKITGIPSSIVDVTVGAGVLQTITLADGLTIAADGVFADVELGVNGEAIVSVYGVLTVPGLPLSAGVKSGTYNVTVAYN